MTICRELMTVTHIIGLTEGEEVYFDTVSVVVIEANENRFSSANFIEVQHVDSGVLSDGDERWDSSDSRSQQ